MRELETVAPFDEVTVDVNRFTYEDDPTGDDADIVAIYGTASGDPERILFADASKILRPAENPSLALYLKRGDDNPVQLQSVHFMARMVSLAAFAGAIGLLLLLAFLRRRSGRAATAASE